MAAMSTRKYEGNSMPYTPGAAVTGGDVIVQNSIVGISPVDIVSGALGSLDIEGIFEFACLESDVVAIGDPLYWDASNEWATKVASTHEQLGYATTASADGVAIVEAKLGRLI